MMSVGRFFIGIGVALGAGLIGSAGSAAQEREAPPPPVTIMRTAPILIRAQPTPEPTPEATETPAPATISGRPAPVPPAAEPAPRPAPAPPAARPVQILPAILGLINRPAAPRRQTEITPPATMTRGDVPGTLTLRRAPNSGMMRTLHVVRRYKVPQLRANPTVSLGGAQVNLTPVLNNPDALPAVAGRLRAAPELGEVLSDDTQVTEVDQGLVVRNYMTYRIKPGTCTDSARRVRLERTGLACATVLPQSARAAAFANPRDPHYVADPGKRAQALAAANAQSAVTDAELDKNVQTVRAALADPAQRPAFDTELGAGEAVRLDAMSDDQIKAEIANSGETSVEQVMFVPNLFAVDPAFAAKYNFANGPAAPAAPTKKPDVNVTAPVAEHIYLTGFTLGKNYEWSVRIEKKIKLCLVGCSHTFYAEVFAGFNYGLGLRFPIKLGGIYTYHQTGATPADESATLTTNFVPVNGSPAQYAEAGLEPDKIFEGKEFVAQFGGHAGAGYSLPFLPGNSIDKSAKVDFTKYLEGDFFDGQFTPPTPGTGTGPHMDRIFTEIDLIGGAANFGVVRAQVFPAVQVTLISNSLTFTVHDYETDKDAVVDATGQKVTLGVNQSDHSSHFSIGSPKYNLSFLVTPGIDARLTIDIAVWSHPFDFPVWFPQLTVKIPSDGATFGCHSDTHCVREYVYTPKGHFESKPFDSQFETDMSLWGSSFDKRFMSECADETCRFGIKFIRQGYIYGALHKYDANTALKVSDPVIVTYLKGAQGEATNMINESQARQTTSAIKSFSTFWIAWWSKQCSDKICLDKVKGIAFFAQLEAISLQKQNPDWSTGEVIGVVGKKFAPVFEAEVKASKARIATEEAAQKQREAKRVQFVPIKLKTQR